MEMLIFCIPTISMSISRLCYYTLVLQDVSIGVKWIKGTHTLSLLFLKIHVNLQLAQFFKFNF